MHTHTLYTLIHVLYIVSFCDLRCWSVFRACFVYFFSHLWFPCVSLQYKWVLFLFGI
uniref:Uncharacterized protein n=1 Tax=Rhizophora mucronata TaxID=61149 RepID=A0A2P2NN16_RHIMU